MGKEQEKQANEKLAFKKFLKAQGLSFDDKLIENRRPPEPDILYRLSPTQQIAFELAEICSWELPHAAAKSVKDNSSISTWTSDPSYEIVKKKLSKRYKTPYLIELVCYTNGRVVSWDDLIIRSIQRLDMDTGQFVKIWLVGKNKIYLLFNK